MRIYETHCHLNHDLFGDDWKDVEARAKAVDVRRLVVVGFDTTSSRQAVFLAKDKPETLRASIGIHPDACNDWTDSTSEEFLALANENANPVVAVGEIGLDYHWNTFEPGVQKQVFRDQLALAERLNLPVIIHCRDAYDDALDILALHPNVTGVLHCFTGDALQAKRALSLGYFVGVGGVITYKNAHTVREAIVSVPLDRILLETDSPYLAPQPWRGKRNEPSYLTAVITKLSELYAMSEDDISEITWQNAESLFG
jgi:TatD DNase family protein